MAIYFILVLIPLLLQFVAIKRDRKTHWIIDNSSYVKENNLALPFFFLYLFFIVSFRHSSIGSDTANYQRIFENYHSYSFSQALLSFDFQREYLFKSLLWIISRITDNFTICLLILNSLTLFPIAKVYCEDRKKSMLKILIFINMSTFIMLFSGIRQDLALGISFIAYEFVRKKRLFAFILTCIIAYFVHHSAAIVLLLYPVYHIRIKTKHLWLIIPIVTLFLIYNQQVFSFIGKYITDYTFEVIQTGAYGSLILFVFFGLLCFILPSDFELDRNTAGLRNVILLAIIIQGFASLHPLAMRLNYYFIILIPIIISKIFETDNKRFDSRICLTLEMGISIFFFCLFFIGIITSFINGSSVLHTVPYYFVWRK